ncbi:AAA family ATPase [Turneriella parva]|uniref:AAA family ATPase n=1 Tax=Turneriella parva TaxID=29510 RepID=UPI001FE1FCFF|nr:ATP-binding protein [Turneriella parva]
MQHLQENEEMLRRALGFVASIASEEEVLQLCQNLHFSQTALAEIKADGLTDRLELFDRLAYLSSRISDSKDYTKLKLAKKLICHLLQNQAAGLQWKSNAFLEYLRENLSLNETELQLLWVLYLRQSGSELDFLNMGISDLADELYVLETCFGMSAQDTGEVLLRDSILSKTGLVEPVGDTVKLPARVLMAIAGNISIAAFQAEHFRPDAASVYSLDSFDLDRIDVEIILALLKGAGPANILLYGKPGCGKTEAARSLIQAAGLDILHVPVHSTGGRHSRLTRLRYADHFSQGSVLIVDEAELILNNAVKFIAFESDSTPAKSVLNTYLDSSRSKTIWILNDTNHLHESTMRRFHFKLHFDKLSRKQRSHALEMIVKKHGIETLVSPDTSSRLLSEEHLSPGVLNQVAHALVQTTKNTPAIDPSVIIDRLLLSNRRVDATQDEEAHVHDAYSLDALNLSISADRIIQSLKSFLALPKKPRNGLNLLFHGLPGTGKTELARYLSHCLNRDLIIKRGSDLLGMYVGSTEQSIAAAFKQAQQSEAILLIDEADTFFRSRVDARQAYEISHTNEFLNQMENHNAILICCTNLIDSFDPAALRRFAMKVEFKLLRSDQRLLLFQEYFRSLIPDMPDVAPLAQALADLENLTPGDFRNVERRIAIWRGNVTWQHLVNELRSENQSKRRGSIRSIGFRQYRPDPPQRYSA